MKPLRPLLLFLFLLATAPLFAVAKPFQEEKVYLHFDNTAYFLGETIWFKAYVVQAGRNALSPLSKTLYVELITQDGLVVESKKLKLTDGKGNGEFQLKDSLKAGFYEVRAYTRFMLNQGDEAIFSRVFACYDKLNKAGDFVQRTMKPRPLSQKVYDFRPKDENAGRLRVFFYPEGGDLIEGLTTRVAFKAFDKAGAEVALTGVVLSKKGDTLASLCTSNQGMGAFYFTPETGSSLVKKPYEAVVTYNNKKYRFDLPQPLASGYTLTVDASDPEQLQVLVQCSSTPPLITPLITPVMQPASANSSSTKLSTKNPLTKKATSAKPAQEQAITNDSSFETLGLNISCRGVLYGEDTLSFRAGRAVVLTFPTRLLPSGVIQINLHTLDGRPLSQRLAFVNHHSQMLIEAKTNKPSYRPYERVNIDFSLKDTKGNPVQTEFSLSVRDAETTPNDPYTDNILTNLLLSSELRGYIQSPGYYFQDDSPERKADLDLLMMTQGWSRYEWKRIAGVDTTQFYHPYEESLLVEGNVYTLYREKIKKDLKVNMLLLYDSTAQYGSCVSDTSGRFNLMLTDFYGTGKLTVETKVKGRRKEHTLRLDKVYPPPKKAYSDNEKRPPLWLNEVPLSLAVIDEPVKETQIEPIWTDSVEARIKADQKKNGYTLKEVQVKGKKPYDIKLEGITNANVMIDVVETFDQLADKGEWVPATAYSALYELLPYYNGSYKGKNTAIILNNRLLDIPLNEISTIDITRITVKEGIFSNAFLAKLGSDYVLEPPKACIFIYTDYRIRAPIGIRQTKLQGYTLAKTFYTPPYDKLAVPDPDDVRRTLYWNPSVVTDTTGRASVNFYNNRSCKILNINAETVTLNGLVGVLNQ